MENLVDTTEFNKLLNSNNCELFERELQKATSEFTTKLLRLIMNNTFSEKKDLNDISLNNNIVESPLKGLKILIIGHSLLNQSQIFEIFNNAFYKTFDLKLTKKTIDIPIIDYKKMKNFDLVKKIKSNRYDYIISGPRPHSTANKGINISLLGLKIKFQLKSIISENFKTPLNKNLLEELAQIVSSNWKNEKLEI